MLSLTICAKVLSLYAGFVPRSSSPGPAFPTYFATAVMARLSNEGLRLALILAAAATPAGIKLGGLPVAAFLIPSVVAAPFV